MCRTLAFIIAACLCLSIPKTASAQDCPNGNLILSSQQAVTNFISNYPGCTSIAGNLTIRGTVTSVAELINITSIEGTLNIQGESITDISGLANVTSVGGDLSINASLLTVLDGLGSLASIGSNVSIQSCTQLNSLAGLSALTAIHGNLTINDCPGLMTLGGLANVSTVEGFVWIWDMASLQSFDGLAGLTSVGEHIRLYQLPGLASMDGLQNLTSVAEFLSVYENPMLGDVSGLSGLTTVGGALGIFDNHALTEVNGINALTTCHGLSIAGDGLQHINGFEALESITEFTGFDGDNLQTINALRNVKSLERCVINGTATSIDLTSLETTSGDLWIKAWDATEIIGCDNVTAIGGDLILSTSMTNLPDFPNLTSIGGMFLVDSRASLEILDGFNNLESVGIGQLGWGFDMYEHDKVTAVTGLNKLSTIEGDFVLTNCDILTSIEGLQSLSLVEGSFNIAQNGALLDCTPVCNFLQTGTAMEGFYVRWNGSDNTSPCWDFEPDDQCGLPIKLVEANLFLEGGSGASPHSSAMDIRSLVPEDLVDLEDQRMALVADGVSEILCTLIFTDEGTFTIEDPVDPHNTNMPRGQFDFPWGNDVIEVADKFYGFALFKAPEVYMPHPTDEEYILDDFTNAYDIAFTVDYTGEKSSRSFEQSIPVVAPPVVLVHGTYSTPETWTGEVAGQDFEAAMHTAGYKTFAVDYSDRNGQGNGMSSFEYNAMVVKEQPNGIQKALDSFRIRNISVTQVDVVGHSLGGILPRVYASDYQNYNPTYRNAQNYMEGDINRLITIASTHFGSNLAEAQFFLSSGALLDFGIPGWFASHAGSLFGSWVSGSTPSEAVVDQLPDPYPVNDISALALIGRTDIPAHAITCRVEEYNLENAVIDPDQTYVKLYQFLSLLFYYNNKIFNTFLDSKLALAETDLNAGTTRFGDSPTPIFPKDWTNEQIFRSMLRDGLQNNGDEIEILDGEHEVPANIELFDPEFAETGVSDPTDPDNFLDNFVANSEPVGVPDELYSEIGTQLDETEVSSDFAELMRFMIFDNDHNDGVVRVQSQSANLESECPECVTHLENVLHGFAPKYASVQNAVINLLKGGMEKFNPEGFPPVTQRRNIFYPTSDLRLYGIARRGTDAICTSGMVPDHAIQFARIADAQNVVIITRPVNPDATPLIAKGAATKKMLVKPKSSNWGPQKGYLPRNQRYSKLWKLYEGQTRATEIDDYNSKADDNILSGVTRQRHLKVQACNGYFWVYTDPAVMSGDAEEEVVLVPAQPTTSWLGSPIDTSFSCLWGDEFDSDMEIVDCSARDVNSLVPFNVMASSAAFEDDGMTPRYLTADYDLLMVGFNEGPDLTYMTPGNFPSHDDKGQITNEQIDLLVKLNQAVIASGYTGGDVSHHGPENQFGGSKFIDYPLTVFAPDGIAGISKGQILSISMGTKAGYRDLNLKRYINYMRRKGYDLYDNPTASGWQWHWKEGIDGFELEDSPGLPDYVAEQQFGKCLDPGAVNIQIDNCPKNKPVGNSGLLGWLSWRSPEAVQWKLRSTFISDDQLAIDFESDATTQWHYVVSDMIGNVRLGQHVDIVPGSSQLTINVHNLEPGMYFISDKKTRTAVRFLKQ